MADLVKARDLWKQLGDALADTPPIASNGQRSIATMDDLDRALATSPAGTTLKLSASLVYNKPLVLRQPVTLISDQSIVMRMMNEPAPKFTAGLTVASDQTTLVGLEIRHTRPDTDILVLSGQRLVVDQCRVLGDPEKGAKRGIAANGTDVTIRRCRVEDCFGPYPGDDTQAICAWDMGPGLLIEDNYLSGGSETLMIGGSDPSSEARSPSKITIRKNTITKNPDWMSKAVNVKNTLELKNARDVIIEDNDIWYSWGGRGQTGYALMLTPRNQGGKAPYSTVEDVMVRNNRFAHAAAAISLLGSDDVHPSKRMANVTIENNTFTDLDPVKYTGSKRLILIQRGPQDVTIVDNTFQGQGFTSQIYFDGQPKAERLNVSRNTWMKTTYGVFGSGAQVGKAWDMFVTNGTFSGNKEG